MIRKVEVAGRDTQHSVEVDPAREKQHAVVITYKSIVIYLLGLFQEIMLVKTAISPMKGDLSFDTLFTHSPILLDGGFVSVPL